MTCAVATDLGRRDNNEDRAFASGRIAVIADGVGGAAAGEVASRLAVDRIIELDKRRLTDSLENEFQAALTSANQTIALVVDHVPDKAGMGTTLTAVALSNEGEYLVANVGDSRTYLYRDNVLRQLTRDDSLIQALIDYGELTEEEARDHPARAIVTAVLDGTDRTAPTIRRLPAAIGDRLLLCSDGLSDAIADERIEQTLTIEDRDGCARELIDQALAAGARDNITVIVADVKFGEDPDVGWLPAL